MNQILLYRAIFIRKVNLYFGMVEKNCNGRPFFSWFFVARANQKIRNLALGHQSSYSASTVGTKYLLHNTVLFF
jgi:hypothetical protein